MPGPRLTENAGLDYNSTYASSHYGVMAVISG